MRLEPRQQHVAVDLGEHPDIGVHRRQQIPMAVGPTSFQVPGTDPHTILPARAVTRTRSPNPRTWRGKSGSGLSTGGFVTARQNPALLDALAASTFGADFSMSGSLRPLQPLWPGPPSECLRLRVTVLSATSTGISDAVLLALHRIGPRTIQILRDHGVKLAL